MLNPVPLGSHRIFILSGYLIKRLVFGILEVCPAFYFILKMTKKFLSLKSPAGSSH